MRSLYLWLLLCSVTMLVVPEVATANERDGTGIAVSIGDVTVARLFPRLFRGRQGGCQNGQCPVPQEADVQDDPAPVEKKPADKPAEEEERNLSTPAFIVAAVVGGIVALLAFIRRERG